LKDMKEAEGASLIGKISSRFTGDFIALRPRSALSSRSGAAGYGVTREELVSSILWRNVTSTPCVSCSPRRRRRPHLLRRAAEPRRVESVDGLPTNRFQFQPHQPLHPPPCQAIPCRFVIAMKPSRRWPYSPQAVAHRDQAIRALRRERRRQLGVAHRVLY
jgi:hypothetical protein